MIKQGKKPIILKQELNNSLNSLLNLIDKYKKNPSSNDLKNIAINSANDYEIGNNVYKAIQKVKNKNAVFLTDSIDGKTKINYYKGYQFETITSSYFLNSEKKIIYNNTYLLLVNNNISDIEEISLILNECIKQNRPLVILANDYDEIFLNTILSLNYEQKTNIILLKNPEYGENQYKLLNDLALISNGYILNNLNSLNFNYIGKINHIEIDNKKTIISVEVSKQIKNYIAQIKNENIQNEKWAFNEKRLAMLSYGLVEIVIGGNTKTEIREKHMRYEDALWATSIALKGVVPGCGLTLLKMKDAYIPINDGDKIIWNSLDKPFIQILENAGLDYYQIYQNIKKSEFQKLYNVKNFAYEDIITTQILDPLEVVKHSLINATTIAGLLLTTTSLIINEHQPNLEEHMINNEI